MKYLMPFQTFVNEAIDLNLAYPYKKDASKSNEDRITYSFATEKGTRYFAYLTKHKDTYDYNFLAQGGWLDAMTGEKDAFKVLATVTKIFKEIVQNHELEPLPIHVIGMLKDEGNTKKEDARNRIYKQIAARELSNIKPGNPMIAGYSLVDLGEDGLALEPINVDDEEPENEAITMFDGKTDKVL